MLCCRLRTQRRESLPVLMICSRSYQIHIVGEINVPIQEDLIGLPGAEWNRSRQVYSHPEALSQCTAFFEAHPQIQEVPISGYRKVRRICQGAEGSFQSSSRFLAGGGILSDGISAEGVQDSQPT
jgi:hypothetical protein